jgi:hypothetical protein
VGLKKREISVITRIDKLPVALTSYAYRSEYFPELEAMIPTVREHHPDWSIIVGRGPVADFDMPTLEVESPAGKFLWSLPVPLNLDESREGSEKDWSKITYMKAWWIAEVWQNLKKLTQLPHYRLIWLDADARLNGPLDIELDPEAEVIAGPWWAAETPAAEHNICSGLVLFQGASGGIVEALIRQWSQQCLAYIQNLPSDPPSDQPHITRESDQSVLTGLLNSFCASNPGLVFLKLDVDKYCGMPDLRLGGKPIPGALVDQWMMNEKMRLPQDRDRAWPPPEEVRRPAARNNKRI